MAKLDGMTVFNTEVHDTKKQPMFFGKPLGVQRYDNFKTIENHLQKKLNENNLLVVPLRAKDNILGFMILCDKETRQGVENFNNLDLDILTSLSNQAAVAMDNAKLFKEITEAKQFNESILGSIATGVITINALGEI